jgi:CDP-4-dehydro-6-deoxyglucose reductase
MCKNKKEGKGLICNIQSVSYLTHDVVQIFLKIQDNKVFQYLPGQYVDLIHHDLHLPSRSYSIANYTPLNRGLLELHVRLIGEGKFGGMPFNELREDLVFTIKGPNGSCYLE